MVAVVFLLFLVLALPGMAAPEEGALPNVLLITVDTLRADHLSCYGYHLETSPNIDKLAAEGVRFKQVRTVIPLTGPAHFSLFTSRYPQEHGARINGISQNEEAKVLFLPQILRKFGYATAGFISSWPLTSRLTHLDQWFDFYDEDLPRDYQLLNSQRFAEDVTPRAINWLEANKNQRFFLWVHYFDPHSPYHLRKGFENPKQIGTPAPLPPGLDDNGARERVRMYDSEIGYADHYVGKLLATLDRAGLRDDTLVVLVADHGESLGEHDYVGHGRQLYEPVVRIPLIFRYPGKVAAGKVVTTPVSLLDVTPTVLDLTVNQVNGDHQLPVTFSGRSVATSLNGGPDPGEKVIRYVTFAGRKGWMPKAIMDLFVDFEGLPLKMGRMSGTRKTIWTPKADQLEIYDLAADPFELKGSRPKSRSPIYEAETARLKSWFHATAGASGKNRMTDKDIKILKSLGYLK